MSVFGDLCSAVIADMLIERGNQHQRFAHQRFNARFIGSDAGRTMLFKIPAATRQQTDTAQNIADDEWAENIELKISRCATKIDRRIVAKHLAAQHRQ